MFKNTKIHAKPMGKIKYHIRVKLDTKSNFGEMFYKQILIVREEIAFKEGIGQVSENKITTWCCVDQGTSKIEVKFPKNSFFPNEVVDAKVLLDNTRCNVALTNVRLAVEQETSIRCHGHNWNDT